MITHGGEVEFVKKIINESCNLKTRIKWYSSLLGIGSHLTMLELYLKEKNVRIIRFFGLSNRYPKFKHIHSY